MSVRKIAAVVVAVLGSWASAAAADPVLVAAGDIACGTGSSGNCAQQATSELIGPIAPQALVVLGDNQYESGSLSDFTSFYGPTWGRYKGITHPAVGNHEYGTSGAAGYFDYFDGSGATTGPAGDRGKGYYSWDLGSWHLIALNSNCGVVSCAAGSAQEAWLRSDLAAHPASCTLAYMHHPRWSSDDTVGSTPALAPLVSDLYAGHVDLMLAGHAHTYERFGPQDPTGAADPNGIAEIIAGTGGKSEFAFSTTILANSLARAATLGVLELTLHATSYDFQFVPAAGQTFTDSGSGVCHGRSAPADTTPPAAPNGVVAAAGDGTASLSWNANTEPDLAGYDVYRSTTSGGPYAKVDGSLLTSPSFADSGLVDGTTYYYVVRAVDASGNVSAPSAQVAASPVAAGALAPGAVTGSASLVARTSATLNGSVAPNGQATTWWVEWGRTTSYGSRTQGGSLDATAGTTSVSEAIGSLARNTTYHYRVVAQSAGGTTRGGDVAFRTAK